MLLSLRFYDLAYFLFPRKSAETLLNEEKFLDEERLKVSREKAKQASLLIASQYKGGT